MVEGAPPVPAGPGQDRLPGVAADRRVQRGPRAGRAPPAGRHSGAHPPSPRQPGRRHRVSATWAVDRGDLPHPGTRPPRLRRIQPSHSRLLDSGACDDGAADAGLAGSRLGPRGGLLPGRRGGVGDAPCRPAAPGVADPSVVDRRAGVRTAGKLPPQPRRPWTAALRLYRCRRTASHFGLFDGAFFGRAYARNFYDTDQRPLRGILASYPGPMLVVHGDHDSLVPAAAAREHHRMVPQSELVMLDGGHFLTIAQPELVAGPILDFVGRAEAGQAMLRTTATPERVRAAATPFDPSAMPPAEGLALVVAILLLVAATFVSEDLTCIGAGFLIARGSLPWLAGTAACFVGIFLGDLMLYAGGRIVGRPIARVAPLRWLVRPEDLDRACRWFEQRSALLILTGRFFPGTPPPHLYRSGRGASSFRSVRVLDAGGGSSVDPTAGGCRRALRSCCRGVDRRFQQPSPCMAGRDGPRRPDRPPSRPSARHAEGTPAVRRPLGQAAALGVLAPVALLPPRRRLGGLARPSLSLPSLSGPSRTLESLRRRDSWANPSRRSSSRSAIGSEKPQPPGAHRGSPRPVWSPPESAEQLPDQTELDELVEELGGWPVVVKPDVGERGAGVSIVRGPAALAERLREARFPVILQEHVPGAELGIFYYRFPGHDNGQIFGVTEKRQPTVVGDRSELRREPDPPPQAAPLPVQDLCATAGGHPGPRARRRRAGRARRTRQPLLGLRISGRRPPETPLLATAVNELSRSIPGFYFGRYDLRGATLNEIRAGPLQGDRAQRRLVGSHEHLRPRQLVGLSLPNPFSTVEDGFRDRRRQPGARDAPAESHSSTWAAVAPLQAPARLTVLVHIGLVAARRRRRIVLRQAQYRNNVDRRSL